MVKLIDFHAEWCGPCKKQEPIIEEIKEDFEEEEKDLVVKKFDIEDNEEKVNEYEVKSVPTLIIENEEGEVVEKFVGLTNKDDIVSEL